MPNDKDVREKENVRKKKRRKKRTRPRSQTKIFAGIAVLTATISALLFFSEFWAFTTWAGLKMDEILYHLRAPLEGTGGGMLEKYASRCILPSVLIMLSIFAMIVHTRHAPKARGKFVKQTTIGAAISSQSVSGLWSIHVTLFSPSKHACQIQDSLASLARRMIPEDP